MSVPNRTPSTDANEGLLLCGHGSSNAAWNERVRELAAGIARRPAIQGRFGARVAVGFLEGAAPDLATAARALLRDGADSVRALPLFLTASSHLEDDLPAVLGIDQPQSVLDQLAGEGIGVLPLGSPVRLLPPLAGSEALGLNAARRARALAVPASKTIAIFTYYGSPRHPTQWQALVDCVGQFLVEREGFNGYLGAPVGHWVVEGPHAVAHAVRAALQRTECAAIIPLLISVSGYQTHHIPAGLAALSAEERTRVRYAPDAILPCPAIEQWAAEAALRE